MGDGIAHFFVVYAPTQCNSTEHDLYDFYSDLQTTLDEARKSEGSRKVPVLCDFNINLGSNEAGVALCRHGLGSCFKKRGNPICVRFLAFCDQNGISVVQKAHPHPSMIGSANAASLKNRQLSLSLSTLFLPMLSISQ
jgi:hypothetical protein